MRQIIMLLATITIISCDKTTQQQVFFEKDFTKNNTSLEFVGDTISKDVTIGSKGLEVPAYIEFVAAIDKADSCRQIGYLKISRKDNSNVKVSGVTAAAMPCHLSERDESRIQTLLLSGNFSGTVDGKLYQRDGSFGQLTSEGNYEPNL